MPDHSQVFSKLTKPSEVTGKCVVFLSPMMGPLNPILEISARTETKMNE